MWGDPVSIPKKEEQETEEEEEEEDKEKKEAGSHRERSIKDAILV